MDKFSPEITDDYYSILGVNKNCEDQIIKNTYRKLARKYHPDKNINCSVEIRNKNENILKIINEAYNILSDTSKRKIYDNYGKMGLENNLYDNNTEIFNKDIYQNIFNFFVGDDNYIEINGIKININNKSKKKINKNIIIPLDTFVKIKGLSNNNYNNSIGKIINYKNDMDSNLDNSIRYIVELSELKNKQIAIKENNFQQIIKVKINNLVNAIELNDEYGDIIDYDNEKRKYKVVINDEIYYLKHENIIIPKNTSVKIINFKNSTNFNNTRGIVLTFNKFNKEYQIKINEFNTINIDCNNLII